VQDENEKFDRVWGSEKDGQAWREWRAREKEAPPKRKQQNGTEDRGGRTIRSSADALDTTRLTHGRRERIMSHEKGKRKTA